MKETIQSILGFWFGDAADDTAAAASQAGLWWGKNDEADRQIGERFEAMLQQAAAGELDAWKQTPQGRLALILLLDQFPRNIYRGTPQAFAYDARARQLTLEGLESGDDKALRPIERVFFYLPLEHAEDLSLQQRCVALFEQLQSSLPEEVAKVFGGFTDFAHKHLVIIERFGRFPHRNDTLGRESTAEEIAFLATPNSSF